MEIAGTCSSIQRQPLQWKLWVSTTLSTCLQHEMVISRLFWTAADEKATEHASNMADADEEDVKDEDWEEDEGGAAVANKDAQLNAKRDQVKGTNPKVKVRRSHCLRCSEGEGFLSMCLWQWTGRHGPAALRELPWRIVNILVPAMPRG